MSAHLSSSARRTEARPVGYRSLASERCFRATSRRRTTLRSPNSRLGRGNVDRHRDRGNDDEIVHALAVHRAECADDQLCERGQERTRQEQPKSRSAPPRHPRTGPRKLEAKSRILFKLPHAERFSSEPRVPAPHASSACQSRRLPSSTPASRVLTCLTVCCVFSWSLICAMSPRFSMRAPTSAAISLSSASPQPAHAPPTPSTS